MSRRITQHKGDTALTKGISTFTEKGWDVSIPITESAAYDLVVDIEGQLTKVQVKYDGSRNGNVDLRQVWHNASGYQVKKPEIDSFDLLYVYRPTGEEYLIYKDHFRGKGSVKPRNTELIRKISA